MNRQFQPQRGFSLIELLTVIGIIAVLAAILVPSYFSYLDDSRRTATIALINTGITQINRYRAAHDGSRPSNRAALVGDLSIPAKTPYNGSVAVSNSALTLGTDAADTCNRIRNAILDRITYPVACNGANLVVTY